MAIVRFTENSEVCVRNIKVITISLIGYYLTAEDTLHRAVKKIVEEQKAKSYKLVNYNIIKVKTIVYNSKDKYVAQIILKSADN